jgi:S1-C subfamily serine protease
MLTPQMANYLGLENGLYVRTVSTKSEAEFAGLKPHDVILKVGTDAMTTIADWERALNSNDGKSIQITIQREKHQITVTLQVDSKRHKGAVEGSGTKDNS